MKIQFIIVGWHFDKYMDFITGLKQLVDNNMDTIKVFWSCHREPTEIVKSNFDYKVFPNLGLEDGAYQQALDYLDLDDNTVVFFMHDDIIVKDWDFINVCIDRLQQGYAFIGNGINYPEHVSPHKIYDDTNFPRTFLQVAKEETKHFFLKEGVAFTIRESFMCTVRKYLRDIHDFEVVWEEPPREMPKGQNPGSQMGNMQQAMLGWKITTTYGVERISYLSNTYMDSPWLHECERGGENV